VAIVVAVVAVAFGQGPMSMSMSTATATATATAKTSAVVTGKSARLKISNYAFAPATLTVRVGTKITVTNSDQTAHTVTARSGAFDSGTVNPGQSKSFTVKKPGVYAYYCQFHAFMTGTIKVVK
jgi:plastocyanin